MKIKRKELWGYVSIAMILLLAALVRLWKIGVVPGKGAIWQDEAIAGYDAWSIMKNGYDAWGYVNPVYANAWGSGQSMLQTYIMIPFIRTIGLNSVAIRLPIALIGGVTTVILFGMLLGEREKHSLGAEKRKISKELILGMLIMAIIPWNIMISRWALDCNFFPVFY